MKPRDFLPAIGSKLGTMMDEETQLLVNIVGLEGPLCELLMPASATFWNLKQWIKIALGIRKREQRLLVGLDWTDPRGSLGAVFPHAQKCCVTLVRAPVHCQRCGADADLKRCAGCNDAYYCGWSCQTADWQQHRCVASVS